MENIDCGISGIDPDINDYLKFLWSYPLPPNIHKSIKIIKKIYNIENMICSVCCEKYENCVNIVVLLCGHDFHQTCINKWFYEYNKICPLCRRKY